MGDTTTPMSIQMQSIFLFVSLSLGHLRGAALNASGLFIYRLLSSNAQIPLSLGAGKRVEHFHTATTVSVGALCHVVAQCGAPIGAFKWTGAL